MRLALPEEEKEKLCGGRDRRGQMPNRRSNQDWPVAVETRSCVGHWKGDTEIGAAHKSAIVTVVERRSGFAVLSKMGNKTAAAVGQAIIDRLKPYAARVITLTYDNGKKFADHERIDAELGSTGYFVDSLCQLAAREQRELQWLATAIYPQKTPIIYGHGQIVKSD